MYLDWAIQVPSRKVQLTSVAAPAGEVCDALVHLIERQLAVPIHVQRGDDPRHLGIRWLPTLEESGRALLELACVEAPVLDLVQLLEQFAEGPLRVHVADELLPPTGLELDTVLL